jgi:UDP-N-acetylmuramate: L-alanyl-gamma-D-glutamyl-meso-diaminopimelate ligase
VTDLHILGVCGTFMGSLARLARELDYTVSGCDHAAYPPMSEQLAALGIEIQSGFDGPLPPAPTRIVVGNALSRGMPVVEHMLEQRRDYTSGPAWLHDNVLRGRRVVAVAGTHGKTTTTSMLAWILEWANQSPGFLIGGVPGNFGVSARLGNGPFVVEADEYDTAFFDKRAKLVHYPADILIINNIEFDHADIYPNIDAIVRQFQHGLRLVPASGHVIRPVDDANVDRALAGGCWSTVHRAGLGEDCEADVRATPCPGGFEFTGDDGSRTPVRWSVPGQHNMRNAMAAMQAAHLLGVPYSACGQALADFQLPARRLEQFAVVNGIAIYLDFAHHPTAIRETLKALRDLPHQRVIAAVELRSNTMRAGVHGNAVPTAIAQADMAWVLGEDIDAQACARCGVRAESDADTLAKAIVAQARPGDLVLLMSNGDLSQTAAHIADALAS